MSPCAAHTRASTSNWTSTAPDKVAYFANVGALYRHWSVLATYHGRIHHLGDSIDIDGLCTVEYATGVGTHSFSASTRHKLPVKFLTYHVLILDHRTQILLVQGLGPAGCPVQEAVYLHAVDDCGAVFTRGFDFHVREYRSAPQMPPTDAPCASRTL